MNSAVIDGYSQGMRKLIHPALRIWFGLTMMAFHSWANQPDQQTIVLTENQIRNLNLKTVPAAPTQFKESIFVLGRTEVAEAFRSVVSSRIAGRVMELNVHPGDRISQGDVVAVIESRQPGNPPPRIDLTAPLSGTVMGSHISIGEPVEPSQHIMEISDLSQIHAVARIPEDSIGHMQMGMGIEIHLPALGNRKFEGTLIRMGSEVDPANATLDVHFLLDNSDRKILPGMRTEFFISTNERDNVIAVPNEAIQGSDTDPFVFVRDYDLQNVFIRCPVLTGQKNHTHTEIINGIFPLDEVVTQGAYSLAFAGSSGISLKEALDAAHGHEHNEDGSEMTDAQKRLASHNSEHDHQDGQAASGFSPGHPLALFLITSNIILLLLLILSAFKDRSKRPQTQ